jgi:signal transduction histidine kinase
VSERILGETNEILPGFWPDAETLKILGQKKWCLDWDQLIQDPAFALLLLQHATGGPQRFPTDPLFPIHLNHRTPWHFVDWRHPIWVPIYQRSLLVGQVASQLAEQTESADPRFAWALGVAAHVGYWNLLVQDPKAFVTFRLNASKGLARDDAQRISFGRPEAHIRLRAVESLHLPHWVSSCLCDPLSSRIAMVVALADVLVAERPNDFGPLNPISESILLQRLELTPEDVSEVKEFLLHCEIPLPFDREWTDPREVKGLLPRTDLSLLPTEDDRFREAKLRALAEFAAGAAHEINNPLAIISSQTQWLFKNLEGEQYHEPLRIIFRQVDRVHSILTDLMQFARPLKPQPEAVSLLATCQTVLAELRSLAESRSVLVNLGEGDALVYADQKHLERMVKALMKNAIEAAHAGGWVRLRIRELNQRVELLVEDSGSGIPEEIREHLFDPFFSGRNAGRGRGLGLPAAWRLARENGGEVILSSPPNLPTRFILTLPTPSPDKEKKTIRRSA